MENSTNKGNKNYTISKFPYLCTTQNLLDLFLIIGYDDDVRTKEIQKEVESIVKANEDNSKATESSYFSVYQNQLEVSLLSSVCSKENKVMLECDLITKLIFQSPPPVYYTVDALGSPNKKYDPNQYSVVFFMNSDTLEATSKIPFHGYSYIFYEKKEEKIEFKQSDGTPSVVKNLRVYVPKAFTFVSQFPYFSQFFVLAKSIHELYQPSEKEKEIEIPIEILLYNIINFTPAPINNNMNIAFLPVNDLATIKRNYENNSKQDVQTTSENIIQETTLLNNSVDIKPQESIGNFPGLSGYPLFDFNLSEIFNILPLENIVEILIFNFLEIDTLFFSKNIEVLNIVMYIISSLNYPCNDTIYLWHIVSVSKKELEDSSANSKFIGKPFTTMVGVNTSYNETIDTSQFTKAMFIADLDKKEFLFKYSQADNSNDQDDIDIQKLIKLYLFIDKIINDKSIPNPKNLSALEMSIRTLVTQLDIKCKKVIHSNYSYGSQIIPKFLIEHVNYQTNKYTQEIFYDFILNILKTFYSSYQLRSSFDEKCTDTRPKYKSTFECLDSSNLSEEEIIFYDLFQSCTKAGSYLKNFLSSHSSMKLYHIPLVFSEEFLQLKEQRDYNNVKTKCFEIMDNFYIKEKKPIQFNFKEFYVFYTDELKEKIFHETLESKIINSSQKVIKQTKKTKIVYQYKKIELDKEVLFRYIYYLDGLSNQKLEKIFPSLVQMKSDPIKTIRFNEIALQVELSFLENKVLSISDLISLSIITFYALTIFCQTEDEFKMQFEIIFELLLRKKYCLRRYIIISISMYYHHAIYLKSVGRNYSYLLIGYHRLIELFVTREMVPNEEMVDLFGKFESIDNQGINYHLYLNQENNEFLKKKRDSNENQYDLNLKKSISSFYTDNISKAIFPSIITENIFRDSFSKTTEDLQVKQSASVYVKKRPEPFISNELIKSNGQKPYLFKLKNNFCRDGFNKEDFVVKMAANSYYEGDLSMTCPKCEKVMSPRILFHHKVTEMEFENELFTPLKIYKQTNYQLHSYLRDMKKEELNFEVIKKIMSNLLFYQMSMVDLRINTDMLILLDYQPK